jgi:hypothetical protein
MSNLGALRATAEAVAGAAGLPDVGWEDLAGLDALEAAVQLGRLKAMVDGALVAIAERLEETGAPETVGWATAKDFLTHVTGGRKGAGAGLVRVANHTADLPAVRTALTAGGISLAQAGVIGGRVATLPRDPGLRERSADALLALVEDHAYDATDLDRCFPSVVKALDTDALLVGTDLSKDRQERGAHHARFLSFTPDTLGGMRIKGYATVEEAELVKTCLLPLAAPIVTEPGACGGDPAGHRDQHGRLIGPGCPQPRCVHDGRDPREAGVRMWDALITACRRLQATDSLPHAHATTARITITMSIGDLRAGLDTHGLHAPGLDAPGLLPSGDTLSAAAVRRLACDAEIIPAVLGTHSQVLDVGRTQRLVTPGIWTALVLRDQHCAFPGCTRLPIACDAHHIQHWADGGATSLDNLVLLCRKHHTITHQTPWQVNLDPHTRRPAWTPPPLVDDRDRFTYRPASRPPPMVA